MIRRFGFALALVGLYVVALAWHYLPLVLAGGMGLVVGHVIARRKHRKELGKLVREHAQEVTRMIRRVDTAQGTSDRLLRERGQMDRHDDSQIARQSREAPTWGPDGKGGWVPV